MSEEIKQDIQKDLVEAGVVFGHSVSKRHPKMKPYISRVKGFIDIIDGVKTMEKLNAAIAFLKQSILDGKSIVVVGTKTQSKEVVREFAVAMNWPYVVERWLGGTISNFEVIKKRMFRFKDLKKGKEVGTWDKYTKKEQSEMTKEMQRLEKKIGGIKDIERYPDILFVLDIEKDELAVKEGKDYGLKIVGITDTNVDPNAVDFMIPASDDSVSSIKYILDKIQKELSGLKPTVKTIVEPDKK